MTNNNTLTAQDKATVRTAAYGAIALLAAGAPHKAATHGSIALTSATGLVGHVLAAKSKDIDLKGRTVAELADQVLPALTAAVHLLADQDPGEADNFRRTVLIAVDAAGRSRKGEPGPVTVEMTRKITAALRPA
jgi:D-alanyl-D-alanine carboxypeptidase